MERKERQWVTRARAIDPCHVVFFRVVGDVKQVVV